MRWGTSESHSESSSRESERTAGTSDQRIGHTAVAASLPHRCMAEWQLVVPLPPTRERFRKRIKKTTKKKKKEKTRRKKKISTTLRRGHRRRLEGQITEYVGILQTIEGRLLRMRGR